MPDPIRKIDFSRHALQALAAHPELAAETDPAAGARAPFSADEMARALAGSDSDDEDSFKRRLRRLRQRVLMRTMARDLAVTDLHGQANLAEVCQAMSELAEQSIRAALRWLREEKLIVVAMGKLGGRELNVSSDIDLVFVHPDPADPPQLERT